MSPTEYFRLFVLCLCLLDSGVDCEESQKGYDLRVQAGWTPKGVHGVHSDERDHKRWSELSSPRIPTAGFKTSSVARGQSGSHPAEEDHTTDLTSQIQSWYPYPAHRNVPKSRGNLLKKGFRSGPVAQGRSAVLHHSYHLSRAKLARGFSPQVEEAPVGFGPHRSTESPNVKAVKSSQKSESYKTHINPSRPNIFPTIEKTPAWSPRGHSRGVMSEARGYAHVRHIKPGNDKTQAQASSAAGRKFLETGYPSVIQNPGRYSHDSSERRLNLNHDTRGKHHPPPDRAPSHVQGKFKPFQRLPAMDPPPQHHSSDGETGPTQTAAGTTVSPCLNATGNTSVVPSVDGELSITSAPPMQTDGQDGESNITSASPMQKESQDGESSTTSASPVQMESQDATLVPQASTHDGQSESSAEVGPSVEKDKPLTVYPLTVHPPEAEEEGDMVVSSPSEKDQS